MINKYYERNKQFGVGRFHALFVSEEGELFGSGSNEYGQLCGINGRKLKRVPLPFECPRISMVFHSRHSDSSFVLGENGKLYGAGDNERGQIGVNTKLCLVKKLTEISFPGKQTITHVEVAENKTFVFTIDQKTESKKVFGFGRNDFMELTNTTTDDIHSPIEIKFPSGLEGHVDQISAGYKHILVLNDYGDVYTIGSSGDGQCGRGDFSSRKRKYGIIKYFKERFIRISQICAAHYRSFFVTLDFKVYAAGDNKNWDAKGSLGIGVKGCTRYPVIVEGLSHLKITKVKCGRYHTCFVTDDHDLYFCGRVSKGCIPIKTKHDGDILVPQKFVTTKKFVNFFGSWQSSYFLAINGFVYACGRNGWGQLCLNSKKKYKKRITRIPNIRVRLWTETLKFSAHALTKYGDVVVITDTGDL